MRAHPKQMRPHPSSDAPEWGPHLIVDAYRPNANVEQLIATMRRFCDGTRPDTRWHLVGMMVADVVEAVPGATAWHYDSSTYSTYQFGCSA